jgi:quinoprotein glucose dehydrogenase
MRLPSDGACASGSSFLRDQVALQVYCGIGAPTSPFQFRFSIGLRFFAMVTVGASGLILTSCEDNSSAVPASEDAVEWTHYAGDPGGTKYSPLTQINRENVSRLRVAWLTRTGDFPAGIFDPRAHRAGAQHVDGTLLERRVGSPCGRCHDTQIRFETTPIMRNGRLYVSTPRSRVLALDPQSGDKLWSFDPKIDVAQPYAEDLTSRGSAMWDGQGPPDSTCSQRIFLATLEARLLAIDPTSGALCKSFGQGGEVRLDHGVQLGGGNIEKGRYSVTSAPAVVGNLVIVGSAFQKNRRLPVLTGVVRAFDARTGALQWSFDPIPRSPKDASWKLWSPDAASMTGGGNVWSTISVDAERDLVFLPTGSPAPDSYGGRRPGRNDHANSVVAVRASTGKLVWSYQVIHHDLWDYDVAAQPILITLIQGGQQVPAVVVGTKTGMLFVLNRETGVPLYPVEERPVPPSDVPGEVAWPTQPYPLKHPPLHGTLLTPDSVFGLTDSNRAFCRRLLAGLRNEGIFTPPSLRGTLLWPGFWGGINWDGLAWDPERQLVVTTIKRVAMVVQLHPRTSPPFGQGSRAPGWQYMAQEGAPYAVTRMPFAAPDGTPCTPPPWGSLVAVSLIDGSIKWSRPLGIVPWLANVPGSNRWGSIVFGGPLVTAGGVVFVAASQDDKFRAFNIENGALLWEYKLPAGGQASPMTYSFEGTQYVVVAAGGRSGIGSPGDWIVAFALGE